MTLDEMKEGYRKGLVGIKPIFYMELHGKVQQLMKVGLTKTESVVRVKTMIGISESTVWRACRLLSRD